MPKGGYMKKGWGKKVKEKEDFHPPQVASP
jgi:hypothetical protein